MKFLLGLSIICLPLSLAAQRFGGNPPSLKWNQINTDTARVIFPRGMETQGQRVANIVHYLNKNTRSSIGNRQQKVSIVLQNQTLTSNGYVQLGPFRSEFFMTPSPSSFDLGSLKWEEQLALHEYRHVLQNLNFRQGVSNIASYLAGQLGQAALTNIAVPNWFWEGDAVIMETALSPQGRGRLPAFFDGFRALTLDGKHYDYMKIRGGSYKDYVPNHYELGYLMSTYGRDQYGRDFWKGVTTDAVRYRYVFYPFSQSLKHRTGKNIRAFYNAMLQQYQPLWQQYAAANNTPATALNKTSRIVTDYKYLYSAGNNKWIVLKNTYDHIPGFFLLDAQGNEQLLTRPGIQADDYFSYKNGRIVWIQSRYDARWGWKDYGVVKIYDTNTGHARTVTHHTKYFSPDVSRDGQRLIVVEVAPGQDSRLRLLDGNTGKEIAALPNPDGWYYSYPKFSADEQAIISPVRNKQGQMAIVQQSLTDGTTALLTSWRYDVLGAPQVAKDTVYYTAAYQDVHNVFALTPADGKIFQLTARGNSTLHAAVDTATRQLAFSEFSTKGYQLFQTPLTNATWNQFDTSGNAHSAWQQPDFKEGGNILDKIDDKHLTVTSYHKAHRLFNFHSWIPTIDDPNYGITLYGDNILNTFSSSLGYSYNYNEGSSAIKANIQYGAWFPYLQAGTDYRINRSTRINSKGDRLYWNEFNWHAGFSIPLNLSAGLYSRSISLASNYNYQKSIPQGNFRFRDDQIQYLNSSFVFNNQRIRARQHIYSHFGQYLVLQYVKSITNVPAWQLYGRLDLSLPGILPSHSLVLQGAYQRKDTMRRYSFSDNFVYARGYNDPFYQYVYKAGANYHFPIAYPDWGFLHIAYFQRIRGNVFYDYSQAFDYRAGRHNRFTSVGGELFFDLKIGNTIPFSFGARYSRLLDTDPFDPLRKQRVEFIVPLQQLFSF